MRFAFWLRAVFLCTFLLALDGCAVGNKQNQPGNYKVGNPYQINGVWYYPKEDTFYDETGIASWYGKDFHGKSTANGERYDMDAITGAHRTLPMPSIVRVTNLENGRSIKLRVNDRGPYARGRIIDVSRHAAELLGFQDRGTARVRVQFEGRADTGAAPPDAVATTGPDNVRAAPVSGIARGELAPLPGAAVATSRTPAPDVPVAHAGAQMEPIADTQPDGVVTTVSVPARTQLWVQVGAFQSRANADRLVERLLYVGNARVATTHINGKPLHRVRFGPYATVEEADSMLNKTIDKGQNGAQIVVE
ncbi:MAG: septal ring lytic transglycosylase RlpA family protein [Alphaproteobacteria bacterium]|nr:septal ring lytic transglycosylase RlpA family protein [Alphaproteobacteria bacterium]